jgi:hypothetical protein
VRIVYMHNMVHYVLALPTSGTDPNMEYDVHSVASFTPPGYDPAHDGTDIVCVYTREETQAIHDALRKDPGVRPDLARGPVVAESITVREIA